MKIFKNFIVSIAVVAFVAGIVACIWFAGSRALTNSESVVLGIFVSVLSILASWLVSHIYAELSVQAAREDARNNLRTYALKAAEKVTNLSNELGKLASYLQAELDYDGYTELTADLQGKNERIQSAIHLLQTLKSVNDGSLSDWGGVIGDELNEQRAEDQEREEELKELAERVRDITGAIGDTHDAREDIDQIRREIRSLSVQIGGRPVVATKRLGRAKQEVKIPCPVCATEISYRQRAKATSSKMEECGKCHGKFVSRYDQEKGVFSLVARRAVDERVTCPNCDAAIDVQIDNMPGTATVVSCTNCKMPVRVTRTVAGSVKAVKTVAGAPKSPPPAPLTDAIILQVQKSMPLQPWPNGAHQKVAQELGLSEATVSSAINELIARGKFLYQRNGVVYAKVEPLASPAAPTEDTSTLH